MELAVNSSFEQYKDKGLTGLANLGNLCYVNSCVQILSHTYELSDFLKNEKYKEKLNNKPDSVLLLEWEKLKDLTWSGNCTIAPWGFVKSVQKVASLKDRDIFSGHSQNDTEEFLLFLIDCFHEALAREVDMNITGVAQNKTDKWAEVCYKMMKDMYKKEYSEMLQFFYGIHVSVVASKEENEILSLRPEPFSVLNLPIPELERPSLIDCMELHCKSELMEGENAWFNDETKKKQDVNKRIVFWSLPNILIIDLKRWNNYGQKINKEVDMPIENLDLSKFVKGYNSASYVYDLYGICNHSGGSSGGHYHAHVKNANGKWYNFNDTNVNEIDVSSVISTEAYCFFYRKKK